MLGFREFYQNKRLKPICTFSGEKLKNILQKIVNKCLIYIWILATFGHLSTLPNLGLCLSSNQSKIKIWTSSLLGSQEQVCNQSS